MRELHPDVRVTLAMGQELRNRLADILERAESLVARRPSPSGLVIPEVDVYGRLTDLYLAPGTCDRFDNAELVAEIMAAVRESTVDAARQYAIMGENYDATPLAELARTWRAEMGRSGPPGSGNAEE
ncbi:hypothetical protein AB0L57_25585 [Nocardia sp. NPDC052254]|uniref:hypothetical protein n=1 Tax=Nocardia sp. NPDC052254 TaxID=3155681 RepID=UPI003420FD41